MAVRTQCGMTTITVDHHGVARRTICRRHVVEVITATARWTYCPRCDQAPPPTTTTEQ